MTVLLDVLERTQVPLNGKNKPNAVLAESFMLNKVIFVKNVGRFYDASCSGDTTFSKTTLIFGPNGFGKSTLCAILRSLQTNDPGHITGRKTAGASGSPRIKILASDGRQIDFANNAWTSQLPGLSIFDGNFVSENVHSGDVIDAEHRRNLYRVIVGEEGQNLALEEEKLVHQAREKAAKIKTIKRAIQTHVPSGMALEKFLELEKIDGIDAHISEQQITLEGIRQTAKIKSTPGFQEMKCPEIPGGLMEILTKTLEGIAEDAEQKIVDHLSLHNMHPSKGRNWLLEGLEHSDESCPFCGQSTEGVALIEAYRSVFSQQYNSFRKGIISISDEINNSYSEAIIARLETYFEKHKGLVDFWSRYCSLDTEKIINPPVVSDVIRDFRKAVQRLLSAKKNNLLEAVNIDDDFQYSLAAYESELGKVEAFNKEIHKANLVLNAKKEELGNADVSFAEKKFKKLQAVKTRYSQSVDDLCQSCFRLQEEESAIKHEKNSIRDKLNLYTASVVKPYEDRINELLDDFNAGFSISETKHNYIGGVAASSYQLVINETAIDVGGSQTPNDTPSFKNTLSAGDRSTLALAFFLESLERDADLENKIAVFDDPFNSQDSFRRRQTIHEIVRLSGKCAQVVVLSHDPTFLKQLWEKCLPADRKAIALHDAVQLGTKIVEFNLEAACQGRTATDIDDLQAYYANGVGQYIDVIRKMRGVLETYMKATYRDSFQAQRWLGDIVGKLRELGNDHLAFPLYNSLDAINDYTSQYHHGEDVSDTVPDYIDPRELRGYVKKTLKIVNAFSG